MMTGNYYVKTFTGLEDSKRPHGSGDFYWTYRKFQHLNLDWHHFLLAVENLRRFHLLLVLDWLDLELTHSVLRDMLGWSAPPKKVRPHEGQAPKRESTNNGTLAVSSSRALLPEAEYFQVAEDNALDMLLYRVVQRMVLERHACDMY